MSGGKVSKAFLRLRNMAKGISVMCTYFFLVHAAPALAAGEGGGASGEKWKEYIANGVSAAHGLAIAFSIFAGLKIVAQWHQSKGDQEKDMLMKWAIGFGVILLFFPFVKYFNKTVLGQ